MIHKFVFADMRILLDVNSGSVHIIDDLIYNLLDVYNGVNKEETKAYFKNQYALEEIEEGLSEIDDLIKDESLFTEIFDAKDIFDDEPIVKSLCLNIAHDCNLRCKYCFASTGEFGGARDLMSKKVGEKAIDFAIKESKNRKNLDVDFFGGEPLVNVDVVKHLINYARKREVEADKNIKLTLTTNGVLLNDDLIGFLNENNVLLVLSLDGRKEIHDKMRPDAAGNGSYDKAVKAFEKAIKSRNGKNYYLRGTYTKENLDFTKDVESMAAIGKELSMEPVVEKDADYKLTEKDLPQIFDEYENLAHFYLDEYEAGKAFNFFHFNVALDGGPCLPKRLSGCGAGHEYFAITPKGEIYPCHQFVGREEYLLGNLDEGIKHTELSHKFRNAHILNKPECMECWARFYCSGGCHANADLMNNDIYKPYELGCKIQRKRIECAIAVQAKIALKSSGQ